MCGLQVLSVCSNTLVFDDQQVGSGELVLVTSIIAHIDIVS